MDHLRRRRWDSDTSVEELDNFFSDESDLERSYIQEEQKRTVRSAMKKLHGDYRQVLWLVYFEGFSNRETGMILRKSERQIRNLLYRAKQALRVILEKEGFIHEEF